MQALPVLASEILHHDKEGECLSAVHIRHLQDKTYLSTKGNGETLQASVLRNHLQILPNKVESKQNTCPGYILQAHFGIRFLFGSGWLPVIPLVFPP